MRTLRFSMERKTFLVRCEGEFGGNWCSITKHSKRLCFRLRLEKEEVGWLIEHLAKAIEPKSLSDFQSLPPKEANFLGNCPEASKELRFLKVKGGYTIHLRRWSPRVNTEVLGKFREGWIELRGLPFHLWFEARGRILMKERIVLPALIEVIDGGWVFTILITMVGVEDERRVRGMGESTRGGGVESHKADDSCPIGVSADSCPAGAP
ncbi:hypothetical protein CK203_065740 [Vitis vinifera]|uniref:DUF4283 domain-containing protein n=1 Tax=Vitis vinifera TaxID=29760 RepID=A0A438G3D3_VITVI|nr:hypothetical protein CK203_065740 [Vitis vinifera]